MLEKPKLLIVTDAAPSIKCELYQLYFKMCYKEFELFFAPMI